RSITLDLRKPAAVEVVKRLATRADVVWENFRPGVMDRLGLGYKTLAAINPRLIYCAVSGFGHTGPERTTAAFDGKLQAMSGIMSITGEPAGGPMRAGFAICDTIGAMAAALAVWSALYQRTHRGRGQVIEGALATDDPKTWEAKLTAADVPCACIWKIDEIVEHPQLEHRDVLQMVDSRFGPMKLVGSGFRLAHGSPSIDRAPPILGEH